MADGSGDRLWALYNAGQSGRGSRGGGGAKPLVILIHGIAGCEDSSYIITATRYFLEQGYPTLRLNLRGAGPSRPTCSLQSHAGRSRDLAEAVRALGDLAPATIAQGFVVVGFSLAGNMSLKFAAEYGGELPLRALVTISSPIDLAATSASMLRPRNALYNRKLLADFCRECLAPGAVLSGSERDAILAARNFVDLDDNFIAPRNGYKDAYDYWENCQAKAHLAGITTPTLLIHAHDDPIVPISPYLNYPWQDNSALEPVLSRNGGHVGFHGAENKAWHLDTALKFLGQRL